MVGGRKPRRRARHYSHDPLSSKIIDHSQSASDYPPESKIIDHRQSAPDYPLEGRERQEFGGYVIQNQLNSVSEPTQVLTNADYRHQGSSAPAAAVRRGQKNSMFFVARNFYTLTPGTGYMIQDRLNSVSEPTQVLTNADYHHQGSSAPAAAVSRGQKNSMFFDDGVARNFYTLPPGTGYMIQDRLNSVSEPTQVLTNADYHHQGSSAPAPAVSNGQKNSMFFEDGVARNFYTLPPGTGYMIQDQLNSVSEATQVLTNADYHHQGSSTPAAAPTLSSGHKNSMFFDDGVARNFYPLPPGTGYMFSTALPKSDSMRVDVGINGGFGYSEMLRCRGMYEERDKENARPRDTSFMVPSSQALTFRGTSSSSYTKDQLLEVYGAHIHHGTFSSSYTKDQLPEVYDAHVHRPYSVGISKLSDGPLEWNDLGQVNVSGFISQGEHPQLIREGAQKHAFLELSTSEKIAQGFLVSDNVYKNVQWTDTGDTLGSFFTDLTGGRIDRENTTHRISSENSLWHQRPSLHRDASVDYHDMKMVSLDSSIRKESSRDDDFAVLSERDALSRDPAHISYRERSRIPLMTDHHRDVYQRGVGLSRGIRHKVDMHMYDLSAERIARRNYGIGGNVNQFHSRGTVSDDRNSFRRMHTPSASDDMLIDDIVELPPSKKHARGYPHHRMSASDACLSSGDSPARSKGSQRMSLKQRLKPASSKFPGSFPPEKRDGVCRPFNKKSGKRDSTDQHSSPDAHLEDASVVSPPPLPKPDPPEDSEEFKRQVQKAFLRFSKVLNESTHQQRIYLEQGNAGSLSCGVCGSLSKEFVDTHSLVSHTYSSCKVGLKVQHMGLHKALCFLMGWNWLMHPNNKLYQSSPVSEAKDLKEDLILWPPLVIIHNSSISNRINTNGSKVVSVEGMEDILTDMGFGAGRARIRHGKPTNESSFLVKFLPTLSGLQESERLHKYFAAKTMVEGNFSRSHLTVVVMVRR